MTEEPELARLIVPLDTSVTAESVLHWAALVARDHAMVVHLIAVWSPEAPVPSIEPGKAVPEAVGELRRYLEEVAQRPELAGARVEVDARSGDVVEEIHKAAAEHPGTMVMLATHGRGGYQRAYLGSVTDKLLRTLRVPVLTLPAPNENGE